MTALQQRIGRFQFDPYVGALGVLAMGLSSLVVATILVRGNTLIPPEGDLTKSLTFNGAIGIYYLTLAFYVPLARFGRATHLIWVALAYLFTVYGLSIETVQIFRGLDPRFSEASSSADDIAAGLFGLAAVGQIGVFSFLAFRFFRQPASLIVLAIRYAVGSTALAFAAGIWMSLIETRDVGDAGNLLALHAMGFHGLQAIPILAWLLERSNAPANAARRSVHLAGAAWILACAAVAWQTAAGRAVTDLSPAALAAGLMLAFWLITAGGAFLAWHRAGRQMAPPPQRLTATP
jgi:hypothetical protein